MGLRRYPLQTPAPDRDQLLARVITRGEVLRRRRRVTKAAAGLAVIAVLFVVAVVPLEREQGQDAIVATSGTTTTPGSGSLLDQNPPTTGQSADSQSEVPATTTTSQANVAPTSTTATSGSSSTAPCRNSRDQACGPYYWDPAPDGNQPLVVEVAVEPPSPTPGETVTFTVTVEDPDARIQRDCNYKVSYGDGRDPSTCASLPACLPRYGAWTPPERQPDSYRTTFVHVYEAAGDYTARFTFVSSSGTCYEDPYGSSGTGSVAVAVAEA